MKTRPILFLLCLFLVAEISAQDLHYSNYDYNLQYLNPAETGSFLGTYRIAASHRDQYDAFIAKPYNTQMGQFDMPLDLAFTKNSWIGYGLSVFTDKSGDLGYRNTGAIASLSYHLGLDKKYRQVISFGMQISRLQRGINDPTSARFSDMLAGGGGVSPDALLIDQFSQNSTNYNLGVKYKNVLDKKSFLQMGLSAHRLFASSKADNRLNRRFNLYGTYHYQLNKSFGLEPRIIASISNNANAINVQLMSDMNFRDKIKLKGGLGYRIQDALQILVGLEYRSWDIGLAYDVTVSSARFYNNSQGAFELGLRRVFIVKEKPKTILVDICPRI